MNDNWLGALLAAAFAEELDPEQRRWCIDYALDLPLSGPMPNTSKETAS